MPFNAQQFLDVFASYNETVFPMQVVLLIAAFVAIQLANKGTHATSKATTLILVFLWLWMGAVYHWLFFVQINPAAVAFGGFFVLEAALLFYSGVTRNDLSFGEVSGGRRVAGTLLIVYGLLVYPIVGIAAGHAYPYSPTFGLPCPTVIFTFGLLLRSGGQTPLYLLPIPVLWSLLGVSAAYQLGVREDLGLLIAGGVATAFLILERVTRQPHIRDPHMALKEN